MYPSSTDSIVAFARGPKGDTGEVSAADLAAAIAALKNGVDPAGDTLAELYALILARAPLDQIAAFSVSPTVPNLAPGNNSSKVANSAFLQQELTNRLLNYLALSGGTMTGALTLSADPASALQAATKQYVDALIQGITAKYSALCATTAALATNTYANGTSGVGATLTATANGALSVDGQAPAAGKYVLVKNEAAAANNGLYVVTQAGDGSHPYILTRASDDDTAAEMAGAFVFVELGTTNAATGWVCAQATITVGTTAITWTQFSGAGTYTAGSGLSLTGTQFALAAISGFAAAAAVSDADIVLTNQGAGNLKQTFAAIKTWVKGWITKTDVGLSAVPNTDCSTQANVVFTGLTAAAAVADADTFPTNQGTANLKQTFAAVKTWIKGWLVGRVPLWFCAGSNAVLSANATYYLGTSTVAATENVVATPISAPGIIKNMYVSTNTGPGGATTYAATLRKNGVDTGLTCSMTSTATTANDTTHTVTVVAGDLLSVKLVTSAGAATANGFNAGFEFQASPP